MELHDLLHDFCITTLSYAALRSPYVLLRPVAFCYETNTILVKICHDSCHVLSRSPKFSYDYHDVLPRSVTFCPDPSRYQVLLSSATIYSHDLITIVTFKHDLDINNKIKSSIKPIFSVSGRVTLKQN